MIILYYKAVWLTMLIVFQVCPASQSLLVE